MRLLLVEDDAALASGLSHALQAEGYASTSACRGAPVSTYSRRGAPPATRCRW
jgi:DNA-binding response OmpR family regulator